MAIAGTLEIQLLANVARLSNDMAQVKGVVGNAMAHVERVVGAAKYALGSLGIGLSAGLFVAFAKSTIDAMDKLNDLSKATGIAVEKLSGLKLAAQQSGSDLDSIAQAVSKLSVNMGKAPEKFEALGISAKDPLKALQQLADVFTRIEDPQLRAAVMAEALGKSWAGAAPLLAEGGRRIGEMVAEGERLSGVTKRDAEEADKFNDQLVILNATFERTKVRIVGDMLPGLNAIMKSMQEGAEEGGKFLAVMRGIQTLFTGDDLHKANVEFVQLTNAFLEQQNLIDRAKAAGAGKGLLDSLNVGLDKLESRLDVIRRFREDIEATQRAQEKAAKPEVTAAQVANTEKLAAAFLGGADKMKKATDEIAKHNARMRDIDNKGWVAYVETMAKEYEDGLKQMAADSEAFYKEKARLQALNDKGWVDAIDKMADEYEDGLRAIAAMQPSFTEEYFKAQAEAQKKAAQEAADAWKKYTESVKANFADMSNSLTDALLNAFTAGKDGARVFIDWLKAEFARVVLRPQLQGAVNSMFGMAGINGTGGAGIFGGVASAIGNFFNSSGAGAGWGMNDRSLGDNSLSGEFAEGLAKFFGGTATAGQGWTGMAGVFAGVGVGLGVGRSIPGMLGSGDTHHDNANIGTVVGGIIGAYWGAAGSAIGAAIGGIAGGILDSFNPGDAERTANIGTGAGDYTYGSRGGKFGDIGILRGTDKWFSDADMGQTLNKWFQTIGKLDAEVARHFSGDEIARATAALAGKSTEYSFGVERTALNPETLTEIVRARFTTIFGVIDSQMADLVTNFKGSGEDLVTLIVDLATVHERLTGLQASFRSLFGQDVGFADIAALKGDTEGYTEALERLSNEYAVTNQIAEMLGKTQAEVWGAVGLASEGARAKLINLAGGLEALAGQLDFYYSHFYTTQEQQAHTLAGLQQAFSDVGVGMPRTLDGFRAITDNFLGMGEAGAQAAASMLALAPTFYQYIQAIEAVDSAIRDNGASFAAIFGEQISTDGVQLFQRNGEVLTATLARITSEFTATNELLAIFGLQSSQVFGTFGLASEEARAKLIDLSGGLDAFTANLAGFYRNYFNDAERAQRSTESLQALFASLGLEMPTTLAGFREMVQQQLLLGPSGAAAAAALLGVQQAFFDLIAPANAIADAVGRVGRGTGMLVDNSAAATEAINTEIDLRNRLFELTHTESEVLERNRQIRLDELRIMEITGNLVAGTLTSIQEQIYAQEDLNAAMQATTATFQDFFIGSAQWWNQQVQAAQDAADAAAKAAADAAKAAKAWSDHLTEWLNRNALSDMSPLTAQQQLEEARRQYSLALGGTDVGAITRAADALLAADKAVEGFGGGYSALYAAIRDDLAGLADAGPTLTPGESAIVSSVDNLYDEMRDTKETVAKLLERLIESTKDQTSEVAGAVKSGATKQAAATDKAAAIGERR